MNRLIIALFVAAACLAACKAKEEADAVMLGGKPGSNGRYIGVGIYRPSELWTKLAATAKPAADPAAATLDDDDAIIVVVDSRTGDIRQCGNLSGYCISMSPWKESASAPVPAGPVALTEHAADLRKAAEAAAPQAAQTNP